MLKKTIAYLTPSYRVLKNRSVFLLLFMVAFFMRFPFFFRDYIDRDESTFILLGQSWAEGNLPYTQLWDLKPPVIFLFFAGSIYAFGKSFFAIRLLGTLAVTFSAFFTYKIGETTASKKVGVWSAIVCVILQSSFGSLQGVMSEHICMLFFMPALYLLISKKQIQWYAVAGVLMGLSVMTKLNMAYAILLLGVFIVYEYVRKKEFWAGIQNALVYGMGIILVILLTMLPYHLQDNIELWLKSVLKAPLEYTGARRYSVFKLSPIFILLGGFFLLAWKKKYLDYKNIPVQIVLLAIIGVLISYLQGGRINGHYLIQIHPIIIILIGIVVSKISLFQKFDYRPYIFFLLLLLPMEAYIEYVAVVRNKIEKGRFYNGEGIDVPSYIKANNLETKDILFFEYHIGYWLLDRLPPTKAATHPSNIFREELFPFYENPRKTGMEELRFIMENMRPKTIITRKDRLVFDKKLKEANDYIDAYLKQYYHIVKTIDRAEIHQRLE
ncbi:MAG: glycosyltransferase family 39 protein [Bacteroidota bacterium]